MGSPERTFWGRQTGQGGTHRDEGFTDAGEQVWPQRMDEQFVLCEHSQQQCDGQLGAQALQQLQEAGTTVGNTKVKDKSPGDPRDPFLVTGHRHHLGPACTDLTAVPTSLAPSMSLVIIPPPPTWAHT